MEQYDKAAVVLLYRQLMKKPRTYNFFSLVSFELTLARAGIKKIRMKNRKHNAIPLL